MQKIIVAGWKPAVPVELYIDADGDLVVLDVEAEYSIIIAKDQITSIVKWLQNQQTITSM